MNTTLGLPTLEEASSRHSTEEDLEFIPYEQRLNQNSRWALTEGSMFFEDKGAIQQAMRRIAKRLDELVRMLIDGKQVELIAPLGRLTELKFPIRRRVRRCGIWPG